MELHDDPLQQERSDSRANGAIDSAVARRLTAEGARVFLAGRTESALEKLAAELHASWQRVDGTDETAVTVWVDRIARQADGIDVMFNAIGPRPIDADYATPSTTIRTSGLRFR